MNACALIATQDDPNGSDNPVSSAGRRSDSVVIESVRKGATDPGIIKTRMKSLKCKFFPKSGDPLPHFNNRPEGSVDGIVCRILEDLPEDALAEDKQTIWSCPKLTRDTVDLRNIEF